MQSIPEKCAGQQAFFGQLFSVYWPYFEPCNNQQCMITMKLNISVKISEIQKCIQNMFLEEM